MTSNTNSKERLKIQLRGEKVGFIGGGNMAKAIAKGLLSSTMTSDQLFMSCPSEPSKEDWKSWGISVSNENNFVFENSQIVILAFKPYQIADALDKLSSMDGPVIIVSLLAGVPSSVVSKMIGNKIKKFDVIRVMPNLSVAVGEGTSVIGINKNEHESLPRVRAIFESVGIVELVNESMMEPLAALVGCGPAYIFITIEALADGAVKLGVPRDMALRVAAQVVLGAAKLTVDTGKHPAVLKDEVCSPGGTTISGIHALENGRLRSTYMHAIEASMNRALEIKKESK
ncbi:UNVERIFIED_CONTAM: hypothetical protein PYX00_002759 [Menopon gallinae]|uniref:Pyrroline-5-carboxylate reductase n=1 Tax=Menopon gallinae TaxID=328185 RepID=A0AAW2HZD5_9NEOP